MSGVESPEDLERLYVPQLVEFLKARGVRSTGNKAELLQLAKLYFRFVLKSFNDELRVITEKCDT